MLFSSVCVLRVCVPTPLLYTPSLPFPMLCNGHQYTLITISHFMQWTSIHPPPLPCYAMGNQRSTRSMNFRRGDGPYGSSRAAEAAAQTVQGQQKCGRPRSISIIRRRGRGKGRAHVRVRGIKVAKKKKRRRRSMHGNKAMYQSTPASPFFSTQHFQPLHTIVVYSPLPFFSPPFFLLQSYNTYTWQRKGMLWQWTL